MEENQSVTLTIDGTLITVPKGTTVYQAITKLGIHVPIFCYQDRMPPFGACRVCLVEVEKMAKLQTSCTLEVTEGMIIHTKSEKAVQGRTDIIEYLLINHPLDCPVCDKGGECPLQEHTYNHGPGISRFFENKRRFKKPLPLGPVLMLDRERCILCARCTRFGDIVAGDHALEMINRGYQSEVGTPDGQPVKSKFIGNTISICPVGALTSQVYRFKARPWDNDSIDSTCTLCPIGCSLKLDSRDGEIMRVRDRENKKINDIWLCDKGWFGYEFVYSEKRLAHPLIKGEKASWEEALTFIAEKIKSFEGSKKLAALGGNPLTLEENSKFQSFARNVLQTNHLDHRIGSAIFSAEDECIPPGMEISIAACEKLKFIVLFGLDVTEEFPVIWLRLKSAINQGAKVIYTGSYLPETFQFYTESILHMPGKEEDIIRSIPYEQSGALFVGSQYLSSIHRKNILSTLLEIKKRHQCSLNLLEGSGNSMGARWAGMHPAFEPNGKKADNPGLNALQILEEASKNSWDLLYIAGANPAAKYEKNKWEQVRKNTDFIVVQELFLTETAKSADVVLPTLSHIEKRGRFLNIAGDIQYLQPGKKLSENLLPDGEIFQKLSNLLGYDLEEEILDDFKITYPNQVEKKETSHQKDTLRVVFKNYLFDKGVRMQHNPHLLKQVYIPHAKIHPTDANKRNIKDGDKILVSLNNKNLTVTAKVTTSVSESVLILPIGFEEIPVNELNNNLLNGMTIEVNKL